VASSKALNVRFQPDTRTSGPGRSRIANLLQARGGSKCLLSPCKALMRRKAFRSIDHVVIRVDDARPLFRLLTERLGLPVVWPLQEAAFATFGWVGIGNTNLEIWASANNADIPANVPLPLVHGFALEPQDLQSDINGLSLQGVNCKPARSYQTLNPEGELRTNFTNSVVLDVSSDSCCIFFCAWGTEAPITPWENGLQTSERRVRETKAFLACGGGALGVVGLREIRMAVPHLSSAREKWGILTASDPDALLLAPGITLQLEQGEHHVISELTLAVRDMHAASAALASIDVAASSTPRGLLLSQESTGGLRFQLIQA